MFRSFFELGGNLGKKEKWVLALAGGIIAILLWAVLAEMLVQQKLVPMENAVVTDRTYLENDSLLRDDYDLLLSKSEEELSKMGLTTEKVYPILPTPLRVLMSFKELYFDDMLVWNSLKSVWLNLLGYFFAIVISIPLGFMLGLIPLFRGLFGRLFDALRFIPLTAVTGIFVMWLGLESEMKVAFLAFGIIVYLVPVVVQRIDEVDDVYLKTVFTLGASNWEKIRTVYFPSVVSRLSDDIRVLTAISWTYITIAEMLNRSGGIGELIWIARRQSRIDKAFAVLIVIVLIGIVQDRLFLLLDRVVFPHKYVQDKEN
ncbi:MAG: ABC transporter permease subunit [Bacteroidia bacterium]|nr:ABC transporter permease subunit [Bacteroidia bacterium]